MSVWPVRCASSAASDQSDVSRLVLATAVKECSVDQQNQMLQSQGREGDVNELGAKCLGRPREDNDW